MVFTCWSLPVLHWSLLKYAVVLFGLPCCFILLCPTIRLQGPFGDTCSLSFSLSHILFSLSELTSVSWKGKQDARVSVPPTPFGVLQTWRNPGPSTPGIPWNHLAPLLSCFSGVGRKKPYKDVPAPKQGSLWNHWLNECRCCFPEFQKGSREYVFSSFGFPKLNTGSILFCHLFVTISEMGIEGRGWGPF